MKIKFRYFVPIIIFVFLLGAIASLCAVPKNLRNNILSKIPFVKNFIINSYSSKTVANSEKDILKIKTAQFDIDFFLKVEDNSGSYIALYPYRVVAGIDMSRAVSTTNEDGTTTVTLPFPELMHSGSSNADDVLVLRDNLSSDSANYDKYFKCVKSALEKKSVDIALEHGLLETCRENAVKVFSKLQADSSVEFTEAQNLYSMKSYYASSSPIKFSFSADSNLSLEKSAAKFIDEKFARDDSDIKLNDCAFARFGIYNSSDSKKTYDKFEKQQRAKSLNENKILMQCYHPFMDGKSKSYFFAGEDGYDEIQVMAQNGLTYYLQLLDVDTQQQLDVFSPVFVYTGLSLSPIDIDSSSSRLNDYLEFVKYYDAAKDALLQKNYASVDRICDVVFEKFGASHDFIKLSSLNNLLYKKQFTPNSIDENFNRDLEIAYVFLTDKLKDFADENARKKLIDNFTLNSKIRLTLEACFLQNQQKLELSSSEISQYADDIIETGEVISRNLFENLSFQWFYKYLKNAVEKKIVSSQENFPVISSQEKSTYFFCDEKSLAFFNNKRRGVEWFENLLEKRSLKIVSAKNIFGESEILPFFNNDEKIVIIFSEQGFFVKQNAIVVENNRAIVFNDIGSTVFTDKALCVLYEDIIVMPETISFGEFSYKNSSIRPFFEEMHDVFCDDKYYAINVSENYINALTNQIEKLMTR